MNPWLSIWLQPRQTIRQIVETNPRYLVLPITMAAGIANGLRVSVRLAPLLHLSQATAMLVMVALGAVLSVVSLYVCGWLYRWVGSWMGGQAKNVEVRAAIAWVKVPVLALCMLWLAMFLISPASVTTPFSREQGMGHMVPAVIVGLATVVLGVWQVVLACHTLGEVHRFSAWKGLGTMLIPSALLIIPASFLLMTAIAIPNVLQGRITVNESAALGNVRALISSLEMYRSVKGSYPAPADWAHLMYPGGGELPYGPPHFQTAGALAGHEVQTYLYTYTASDASHYGISAVAKAFRRTGRRSFYADETGKIHHCRPSAQGQTADTYDYTIDEKPAPCRQ